MRLAKPDECDALTALAMRAKASWGYPDDFMCACQPELTMTPAKIAAWMVWVVQSDQTICGMIALNLQRGSDNAEIEDFFVDPNFHGRGVGATLMSTLLEKSRAAIIPQRALLQAAGQVAQALGRPQQRPFRIATRRRLDQSTQVIEQAWIRFGERLASGHCPVERKRMGTGGGVGDGPIPHEAALSPAGAADSIIASSPAPSWNKRVLRTSHARANPGTSTRAI